MPVSVLPSTVTDCYQRTADKSHPQKPSFPQATQLPALATISACQNKPRLPSSNNTAISVSPTSAATGNLPSTTFTTANPVSSHHTHPLQHHSPQWSNTSHPHQPAQAQQKTPLPASVLPELFPQTALHNKGRLTPGLGGSHPGASKLTKTKHRRHRFCPHQRYPNKSHPHKRKSSRAAPTSRPTATSNDTQTITPSQAHFPPTTLPPTTLPPASVRPALFTAQCHCYQQHHLNKPHPHNFFDKQHCYQHQSHQHCLCCYQHQSYERWREAHRAKTQQEATTQLEARCQSSPQNRGRLQKRWKTLQNLFSRRGHALQSSLTVHSTLLPVAPFTAFSLCV